MTAVEWAMTPAVDVDQRGTADAAKHATQQLLSVDYALVRRLQLTVNGLLDEHTRAAAPLTRVAQRQLAMRLITGELERLSLDAARSGTSLLTGAEERAVRAAVLAALFGLGRLESLLDDPDVEDVYIRGTAPVRVKYADGRQELRPPIADTDAELMDQLRSIATHHGQNERAVTSARPFLNLRLPGHARLAAAWGVTPEPHVTIRRHRHTGVDLPQLVQMGMVSQAMAAFLHAAVLARRSILVVGAQGSGKTTLLRGLAQCLPAQERFATIESEYELLLHELPDRFPNLIPYEAREGMGELGADGRPAGEVGIADIFVMSLRHSLQRVIVGEVRGAEVIPLLMAMSRGYKGSMCTFHANSAADTFQALASTVASYAANWNRDAAMQQIAAAVDLVVWVDREDTTAGPVRYVAEILEVGGRVAENGQPEHTVIFGPDPGGSDPRGYPKGFPADPVWLRRTGFDMGWLEPANGFWATPFPRRVTS